MKKIFAGIALLCFIISCTDSNTKTSQTQAEKNTMHNRDVYDAITTGDHSKLDSFIDKDFVDHTQRGDVRGIDSLKKMFTQYRSMVKDLKMDIVTEASNDDYHFCWYKMSGTAADASMGVPAGTSLNMNGIDVVKIKDGKAVEHWGFEDPKEIMEMMNHQKMGDHKMSAPATDTTKK